MEDKDDVEGVELFTSDGQGQANEDGVEYDAEFEDEDGCHLGGVVFSCRLILVCSGLVDVMLTGVAEMVVTWGMAVAAAVRSAYG